MHPLIAQAYAAFNARDVDGALALMTDGVSWPKASEGGTVLGREAIRAYWSRQWSEFDPHVTPISSAEEAEGVFRVRVHQVVKNLEGKILSDSEVVHVYTVRDGKIAAMTLGEGDAGRRGATAAFTRYRGSDGRSTT